MTDAPQRGEELLAPAPSKPTDAPSTVSVPDDLDTAAAVNEWLDEAEGDEQRQRAQAVRDRYAGDWKTVDAKVDGILG